MVQEHGSGINMTPHPNARGSNRLRGEAEIGLPGLQQRQREREKIGVVARDEAEDQRGPHQFARVQIPSEVLATHHAAPLAAGEAPRAEALGAAARPAHRVRVNKAKTEEVHGWNSPALSDASPGAVPESR